MLFVENNTVRQRLGGGRNVVGSVLAVGGEGVGGIVILGFLDFLDLLEILGQRVENASFL